MSTTSYNFNATIDNQLKVSLKPISPQPTLVSGTVTNRPVEIPAGSQKNLYVEGGDSKIMDFLGHPYNKNAASLTSNRPIFRFRGRVHILCGHQQ